MNLNIRNIPLSAAVRMPWRGVDPCKPVHVFLCIADHFEPYHGSASRTAARERTATWVSGYPRSIEGVADSLGRQPKHSFFYPAEEYDPHVLDDLARLAEQGHGEVEVHLHHDHDSSEGFVEKIETFTQQLHHGHGLLFRDSSGAIRYGFIHGNWALNNARPDGRWCGVNNEIDLLIQTGCYADFTLPCAPSPGQTRMVNSIYYAVDDPERPKSHDWGVTAQVDREAPGNSLLMIQGPLAWNGARRKWGLLPRLENGDLHGANVPTLERLRLWLAAGVSVAGREDWLFVKLHTHGAMEVNTELFLNGPMRRFHMQLAEYSRQRDDFHYYYVTAREMAELAHAAERGETDPAAMLCGSASVLGESP